DVHHRAGKDRTADVTLAGRIDDDGRLAHAAEAADHTLAGGLAGAVEQLVGLGRRIEGAHLLGELIKRDVGSVTTSAGEDGVVVEVRKRVELLVGGNVNLAVTNLA